MTFAGCVEGPRTNYLLSLLLQGAVTRCVEDALRAPWKGACTNLKSSLNHESWNSWPCVVQCGVAEPFEKMLPFEQITSYNNNLLDKAFMVMFCRKME